ncbi:uncharacterized protein [Zea mays]|uniref:uncharacterized protein isoform X5 n=1 Tax=Zea mays TaxID=4577 RepID=UPI0004DE8CD0|nr:uncharacterized protein LOC100192854 isoform X5 [Zea mays]XP_020405238.1 uncharacterized protein LOC100278387 isoform X3 [Zea mays]|eukprot:XP_008644809.1 uncharacterized protein LOC100192854 isoform X4 [Zea mays]
MFMRSDKSSTNHQCQISSLPCLIHLPILGTSGFVASSPSASPSDLAQMPPGRKGQRCTRETPVGCRDPVTSPRNSEGQSHVFKLLSLHERVVFTFSQFNMEEMVAAPFQDGQQPKSPTEVVSNVLLGSSVFLHNVGLQSASKKSSTTTVSAMAQQLQDELEIEKQEKDGLQEEVETLKA